MMRFGFLYLLHVKLIFKYVVYEYYDIYHMQVNEGNLMATIRENHKYFGYYHTAGVPGRHEINSSQEIFYPAVVRAIEETGFSGFIAHEFVATRANKYDSLKEAIEIIA